VALEIEDFSRCGGCTLKAIEQVFMPEQRVAKYVHPLKALIDNDPRMQAALREYSEKIRAAGYNYNHPDDVETDIQERLDVITQKGTIPLQGMSADQLAALKKLQDYEREVSRINQKLLEDIFEPVEDKIEKELYAREVK
jgi:hypothetical protein